jgi:hypothetical protein
MSKFFVTHDDAINDNYSFEPLWNKGFNGYFVMLMKGNQAKSSL